MIRTAVWPALVVVFTVSCNDSFAPSLVGRWAAGGIELIATPIIGELRVSCFRPVRLWQAIRLEAEDSIKISGELTDLDYSFPFTLAGQVRGDTLAALLIINLPAGEWSQTHLMTAGADPGLNDCQYYR